MKIFIIIFISFALGSGFGRWDCNHIHNHSNKVGKFIRGIFKND